MFFEASDLILKEKIKLYNNIANSGDCTGRLDAELQIFPSPRINWKFETLGDGACSPELKPNTAAELYSPFTGVEFVLEEPYINSGQLDRHRKEFSGFASRASYGTLDTNYDRFAFYLSNVQIQKRSPLGQIRITQTLEETGKNKLREFGSAGLVLQSQLDDAWNLSFETRNAALDWLEPKNRNIGTLGTTECLLYPSDLDIARQSSNDKPSMSLKEAHLRISRLCTFLSFANGGYLGPLFIKGSKLTGDGKLSSALALQYRVTPLEQIGVTWLAIDSDLKEYIHCFSRFERMLSTSPWDQAFAIVLAWYFQAIQPPNIQLQGKPMPVVANAIGTALERLSYSALVLDESDPTRSAANEQLFNLGKSKERIKRVLDHIGITKARRCSDIDDIDSFIEIRNDATHPRPSGKSFSDENKKQILHEAIQWIEEVILWRIGYTGKYTNRKEGRHISTPPRYDLSLRNPRW